MSCKSKSGRRIFLLISYFLGVAILVWLTRKAQPGKVFSILASLDMASYYLVGACVLSAVQVFIRGLRCYLVLLEVGETKISYTSAVILSAAGFFIASATPIKTGNLFRGFLAKEGKADIAASSAVEFFWDIVVVILMALIFAVCALDEMWVFITGFGILAAVSGALYFILKTDHLERLARFIFMGKYLDVIVNIKKMIETNLFRSKSASVSFCLAVILNLIYFMVFFIVLRTFGLSISFLQASAAAAIGVFVGSVSLIPMGLGTRDASTYGILSALGFEPELCAAAIIVTRLICFIPAAIGSACYFYVIRGRHTFAVR